MDGLCDLLRDFRRIHLAPGIRKFDIFRAVHSREALGRHEGGVGLEERTDQEEGLAGSVVLEETHGFASHERLEVITLGDLRGTADVGTTFSVVLFAYAFPGVAEIAPKVVDLGIAGPRISEGEFLDVELGLGPEILEPIVEIEAVVEPMRLGVHEMHFANESGHVAGSAEHVGHGLVLKRPWNRVGPRPVVVGVEPREHRGAGRTADGIGAVGIVEAHPSPGERVEMRGFGE